MFKTLGISFAIMFGILSGVGILISIISTQLQCSKISFLTSLKQGLIYASAPSIIGTLGYFCFVRGPFARTFQNWGLTPESSVTWAIAYLVAVTSWTMCVFIINASEKAVCKPSLGEMSEFKKKLLTELHQKELAKSQNEKSSK